MERRKLVLTLSMLLCVVSVLVGISLFALYAPPLPVGGEQFSIWGVLYILIGTTQCIFIVSFYQGAKRQQKQEKQPNFKTDIVILCVCLLIGTVLAIWKAHPGPYIYSIAVVFIGIGIEILARALGFYRGFRWQK